eukprot:5392735-Prymnesium_polylepis.1
MARTTRESAVLTPEPSSAAKKVRITVQNNEDAKVLVYRRKTAHDAARWAYVRREERLEGGSEEWAVRRPDDGDAQHDRATTQRA